MPEPSTAQMDQRRLFILCFGDAQSNARMLRLARWANTQGIRPIAFGLHQQGIGPPKALATPYQTCDLTTQDGTCSPFLWRTQTVLTGTLALPLPDGRLRRSVGLALPNMRRFNRNAFLGLARHQPRKGDLLCAAHWQAAPAALRAQDQFGCDMIYDMPELAAQEFDARPGWSKLIAPFVRSYERAILERADRITAVLPDMSNYLRKNYGLTKPTFFVPNATLEPPLKDLPKRQNNRLVYFGGIRPARGLEEVITSLGRLPNKTHLDIIGYGKTGYKASLLKLAKDQGCLEQVSILPPTPPDAALDKLSTADCGLAVFDTSQDQLRFAQPNKVFFYLAARLNFVVSKSSLLAEQFQHQRFVHTASLSNPDSLVGALRNGLKSTLQPPESAHQDFLNIIGARPYEDIIF